MCASAALSLLETRKKQNRDGGVLTPALAVGETLEKKLLDHEIKFNVLLMKDYTPRSKYMQLPFWNGLLTAVGVMFIWYRTYRSVGFLTSSVIIGGTYHFFNSI